MWSHDDRGSIVLTLLIGFIVVSTVLAGLTTLVPTLWRHSVGYGQHGLALETAESGLVHAQVWLEEHSLSEFDSYPYNTKAKAHKIDSDSSFFVTYDSSKKTLTSTGQYGKSTRQLSLWVHEKPGNAEMEFTQALYASIGNAPGKPAIELTGSSKIIGDVTINATHDKAVRLAWSTTIDGDLTLGPGADPERVIDGAQPYQNHVTGLVHSLPETTTFELPDYPAFPNDLPHRGNFTAGWSNPSPPHTIAASGRYNRLEALSELIFDLTNGDLHIRARELRVTGSAKVNLRKNAGVENGKLFLYVEEVFELAGSSHINRGGDPSDVFMYYSGSGSLSVPGATDYIGSVYIQRAALTIEGSGGIRGNIISGGPTITVNGDSSAVVRMLYAPLADITVTGSSTIRGSIVGNTLTGTGNVRIYYEEVNLDMPITIPAPGGSSGGAGSITFSDWRIL
jgi:hypothetical protein